MIKILDKHAYPLELYKITVGGQTVYDRDSRGKSWFYLCVTSQSIFYTADGERLITSDGLVFNQNNKG